MTISSSMAKVSSKGWVVIPSILRRKIGLKPGMKVMVTEVDGKILLTPQEGDPVESLYGKLAGGESLTNALLKARKEDRAREKNKVRSR